MYELYGHAQSRAFRVLWMLEELGVPYRHHPEKPRSETVVKMNPTGKIPYLVVDGQTIADSTAILQFLADRHGAFTAAAGTLERARQDAMTHRVLDEIDAVLWTAARHSFILPEDRRVPEVKDSLKWEYARNLDRLIAGMEGPYLMGAEPSVPDIILAHCGGWAKSAKFPAENADFSAYLKRMRAREAFRRLTAPA